MASQTLLQLCLILHITGFTMMAGTVLAGFSINRRMGRYVIADKQKAVAMLEGSEGLQIFISAGAVLLILTGIGMVFIFREAVTSMLWFRIKMVLVLLVVLNGVAVARPAILKLKKLLTDSLGEISGPAEALNNRLRIIYISQLILFLVIFVLSVLKF